MGIKARKQSGFNEQKTKNVIIKNAIK